MTANRVASSVLRAIRRMVGLRAAKGRSPEKVFRETCPVWDRELWCQSSADRAGRFTDDIAVYQME